MSYVLRENLEIGDRQKVFDILHNSGFFLPREMAYGMGLFDEHLRRGEASSYQFLMCEQDGKLLAYGCYGLLPLTDQRYHLHWLAVHRDHQQSGLGSTLEQAIVEKVRKLGGTRIYAELSNRGKQQSARIFYEKCGYSPAATIADYYANGDHKILYEKNL